GERLEHPRELLYTREMNRRAITLLAGLVLAMAAAAQESAPAGILRGDLEACSGNGGSGELTFRNADNRVYQCAYDDKTYFERENQRISVLATEKGDPV